jgi:hypothetical protein
MAGAEVLPIVLEGSDNTGGMWSSFVRNAKGGQSAIDQLKGGMAGLQSGSVSSLGQIGNAARMLANPYVAVTALVLGLGGASLAASMDMAKVGEAAKDIGTKGSYIVGLGDALKKVGGDGDTAVTALQNLRSQLDLQSRDGGYLEKLFKLNGSSITDAKGQLKSIEDVYKELAGFILNAKNNTEGLEIASNAFSNGAGPQMKKAIDGGVTSLAALGKSDLDPLIKQSQDVAKIWASIDSNADGWWNKLKSGLAQAGNNITLNTARLMGSKQADEYLQAKNRRLNPDTAYEVTSYSSFQAGYKATGDGTGKGETITPRNNKDDATTAALDRASVAVAKHTAEVKAETAAVDLGAGALAQMQTQAKLTATMLESGLAPTQARREEIKRLADAAGEAAAALAKAKIASEIKFDRGAAFLTPEELQIATQLKTIYGTDLVSALGASDAAPVSPLAAMSARVKSAKPKDERKSDERVQYLGTKAA